MKSKLDTAYLTIFAALGLELACATKPSGDGASETGDGEAEDSANTDSTGDGDGDGEPEPVECANPLPIMQAGTEIPSGFYDCDGFIHRAESVECMAPQGPDDCPGPMMGICETAADCIAQAYGSCIWDPLNGDCGCSYGCATDADCAEGFVCACAGVAGSIATCIPGDCTTNDDCDGGLCGLGVQHGVCENSWALACTTAADECHHDDQCGDAPCPDFPESGDVPWECWGEVGSGWACHPSPECDGICGRPLLVDGEVRIAEIGERADWCASMEVDRLALDADTRERLADHWLAVGRYEHASVASFARFAGHLLRLGAPPPLLRETARAMLDEVEHARLAFGLASVYAGRDLGPGPLAIHGAVGAEVDRLEIVEALIVEACVGETLAALEAHEAAAWAEDPAVRAALDQIAADELRHAALGWRALRWMLDDGDDHSRRFALTRLATALDEVRTTPARDGVAENLRMHGLLDDALREDVRRRALVELLEPCLAALREPAVVGASPKTAKMVELLRQFCAPR